MLTLYVRQEWIASHNREWIATPEKDGFYIRGLRGQTPGEAITAAEKRFDLRQGATIVVSPRER